jgi:phosphoribosylformylglycinamidine synthase
MALASGLGCALDAELTTAQAFGEDQSRYVLTAPAGTELPGADKIGTVGGTMVAGIEIAALREANEAFFKDWMEA